MTMKGWARERERKRKKIVVEPMRCAFDWPPRPTPSPDKPKLLPSGVETKGIEENNNDAEDVRLTPLAPGGHSQMSWRICLMLEKAWNLQMLARK